MDLSLVARGNAIGEFYWPSENFRAIAIKDLRLADRRPSRAKRPPGDALGR
jgi:hypothetical protein